MMPSDSRASFSAVIAATTSVSGLSVMPIKFRCQHCQQLLGISRSQADAVVDCPRCGRALRVPGVDGKTQPLPTNRPATHADEDLRSALTALSTLTALGEDSTALGKGSSAATTLRADAKPSVTNGQTKSHAVVQDVQPVAPSKASDDPQISAAAEHVPEFHGSAEAAEAAQRQPDVVSTSTTTAEHLPDEDLLVPLRELADFGKTTTAGSAANSTETLSSHRSSETRPRRNKVVLAIVAVLLFGNGFLIGRGLFSTEGSVPVEDDAEPLALQQGAGVAAENANVTSPSDASTVATDGKSISGRVVYEDESGAVLPDAGALVLALPDDRSGSLRLDGGPLWLRTDAPDRRAVIAALQQLQAEVTTANEDGRFQLHRFTDSHRLLVISKHRQRAQQEEPAVEVVERLRRWFESVPHLTGRLVVQELSVDDPSSEILVPFR